VTVVLTPTVLFAFGATLMTCGWREDKEGKVIRSVEPQPAKRTIISMI